MLYYKMVLHLSHPCDPGIEPGLQTPFLAYMLWCSPVEHSAGIPVYIYYMQLYTDRYTPWGERIACV